jgi:hypothetical protein
VAWRWPQSVVETCGHLILINIKLWRRYLIPISQGYARYEVKIRLIWHYKYRLKHETWSSVLGDNCDTWRQGLPDFDVVGNVWWSWSGRYCNSDLYPNEHYRQ